jgi:hypothetical protein
MSKNLNSAVIKQLTQFIKMLAHQKSQVKEKIAIEVEPKDSGLAEGWSCRVPLRSSGAAEAAERRLAACYDLLPRQSAHRAAAGTSRKRFP